MSLDYCYINVTLAKPYVEELFELLLNCGIPPAPKHDFHCTVMWDSRKDEINEPLVELDPDRIYTANITGIQELGDGYVFNLYSPQLVARFNELTAAGHQHNFPDIHLHMSLTYDPSKYEMLMLNQHTADWVGRELQFTGEAFGYKKNR